MYELTQGTHSPFPLAISLLSSVLFIPWLLSTFCAFAFASWNLLLGLYSSV